MEVRSTREETRQADARRLESPSEAMAARYREVRRFTEALCAPLAVEDYVIQSMPDVSPTKWHLAHTSWFFETFLLIPLQPSYRPFHPHFGYLFNSYYQSVGERHCRPRRGLLSRPTVEEVYRYRAYVDDHLLALLAKRDRAVDDRLVALLELGLQHEQQHQELILTDIKHVFASNPLRPAYHEQSPAPDGPASVPGGWYSCAEGVYEIGHAGAGFAFDNETPRHRVFLSAFALATRPVTNGEYLGVYGGRRLPAAAALALGRLERRAEARVGRAALLGAGGRALVADDARRDARSGPGRAGLPH